MKLKSLATPRRNEKRRRINALSARGWRSTKSLRSERDFSKTKRRRTRNVRRRAEKKRVVKVRPDKDKEVGKAIGISARRRFNGTRPTLGTNGRRQNARTFAASRRGKRTLERSRAGFFAACFVKMGVLTKVGAFSCVVWSRRRVERRLATGTTVSKERRKDAASLGANDR